MPFFGQPPPQEVSVTGCPSEGVPGTPAPLQMCIVSVHPNFFSPSLEAHDPGCTPNPPFLYSPKHWLTPPCPPAPQKAPGMDKQPSGVLVMGRGLLGYTLVCVSAYLSWGCRDSLCLGHLSPLPHRGTKASGSQGFQMSLQKGAGCMQDLYQSPICSPISR